MSIISRPFVDRLVDIPEILSRAQGGFVDLTFGIVGRSKDAAGAWHFHVRAKHADQIVGMEIVLGAEWETWPIKLGDVDFFKPFKGSVEFRSTGEESDLFSALLGRLYRVPEPAAMQSRASFVAIVVSGDPTHVEADELQTKLFYEAKEADNYAEVFLNVGFDAGIVELREKYAAYRHALVRAIARVA